MCKLSTQLWPHSLQRSSHILHRLIARKLLRACCKCDYWVESCIFIPFRIRVLDSMWAWFRKLNQNERVDDSWHDSWHACSETILQLSMKVKKWWCQQFLPTPIMDKAWGCRNRVTRIFKMGEGEVLRLLHLRETPYSLLCFATYEFWTPVTMRYIGIRQNAKSQGRYI